MPVYHQMGHHTENLVREVGGYHGVILSPVNVDPSSAKSFVETWKATGLDTLLDPQLYFPRSQRGQLRQWSYFPSDFDTADFNSESWWDLVLGNVINEAQSLEVDRVCSPAIVPAVSNDEYYATTVRVADSLSGLAL